MFEMFISPSRLFLCTGRCLPYFLMACALSAAASMECKSQWSGMWTILLLKTPGGGHFPLLKNHSPILAHTGGGLPKATLPQRRSAPSALRPLFGFWRTPPPGGRGSGQKTSHPAPGGVFARTKKNYDTDTGKIIENMVLKALSHGIKK